MDFLHNIWFWISLLLLTVLGTYYLRRWRNSRYPTRQTNREISNTIPRSSLLKIDQTEPQRKPPLIIIGMLFACSVFILAFGIFGLYLLYSGVTTFTPTYIIFIIIFVVLPFLSLLDLFVFDRKYYKIGKSYVERHVRITSEEDINRVFEQCRSALGEMKASIYKKDTPNILKARLGKFIITVRLGSTDNSNTIVDMSSDAQWTTVKFDLGENQKNVYKFQSILERLATMDEMQKQAQPQGDVKKLFGKNVKFVHPLLGEVEIKYLSWGDSEKIAKFLEEKNPRSFTSKVIHNQLIQPQLKLEEVGKWSDTTLEEVCIKLLENEESIRTYFQQATASGFFEKFYSAFKESDDKTKARLANLVKSVQSQFDGLGKQLSAIQSIINSSQLQSAFQMLSSYDFQNLARTIQIVQNIPQIPKLLNISLPSSLRNLAFTEIKPSVITPLQTPNIDVPDTTLGILLNNISPDLERKRKGAWQTFRSENVDRISQSTNSMREVLRQLFDVLGPEEKVKKACWYVAPKSGSPVQRNMRIRYALAGDNPQVSKSTLEMIDSLSDTVDTIYAKLSAQTHAEKKGEYILAEGCLKACEAIIMLVLGEYSNKD